MTKWFRLLGRLEGSSFLILLFLAVPLKYFAQLPIGVRIIGPVHGMLFLAYCSLAYFLASEEKWTTRQHMLAYVAAVLPFGTFLFERKFFIAEQQEQKL